MKILALFLLVFVCGVGLGWIISPGPYRFLSRTQEPVVLTHESGAAIGVLPAGVPLLGEKKLNPLGEFGWFAYARIYFGDESQVRPLVTAAVGPRPSILGNYFRGDPVDYVILAFAAELAASGQPPAASDETRVPPQPPK